MTMQVYVMLIFVVDGREVSFFQYRVVQWETAYTDQHLEY